MRFSPLKASSLTSATINNSEKEFSFVHVISSSMYHRPKSNKSEFYEENIKHFDAALDLLFKSGPTRMISSFILFNNFASGKGIWPHAVFELGL